jgi:hypothetical protein
MIQQKRPFVLRSGFPNLNDYQLALLARNDNPVFADRAGKCSFFPTG